jgi:hypothetical protein
MILVIGDSGVYSDVAEAALGLHVKSRDAGFPGLGANPGWFPASA